MRVAFGLGFVGRGTGVRRLVLIVGRGLVRRVRVPVGIPVRGARRGRRDGAGGEGGLLHRVGLRQGVEVGGEPGLEVVQETAEGQRQEREKGNEGSHREQVFGLVADLLQVESFSRLVCRRRKPALLTALRGGCAPSLIENGKFPANNSSRRAHFTFSSSGYLYDSRCQINSGKSNAKC